MQSGDWLLSSATANVLNKLIVITASPIAPTTGVLMKKFVNILGAKVKIKTFKDANTEDNRQLMGYCHNSPLEIHINNSITKIQKEQTLLHECCHGIMVRVGLDQVLSNEVQEIICESFANFMHENMRFKK